MKRHYITTTASDPRIIRFVSAAETLEGIRRAASKAAGERRELADIAPAFFSGWNPLANKSVQNSMLFLH
jgi:hypothetical protein